MLMTYTAKYTKIDSGYMGQLVKWPEAARATTRVAPTEN